MGRKDLQYMSENGFETAERALSHVLGELEKERGAQAQLEGLIGERAELQEKCNELAIAVSEKDAEIADLRKEVHALMVTKAQEGEEE